MLDTIRQGIRRLRGLVLHAPDARYPHAVLGTEYGGWPVVDGAVTPQSVVYSFGVGEDISFDLALIAKTRCHVWAFDPTPKAGAWLARQDIPTNFHFEPVGISAHDGSVIFFPPANESHVSYSSCPGEDQTRPPVTAPVRRLETLSRGLGHDHIDVLKMDVEGFEYDVIADLLAGPLRPQHLLVEFHHRMYGIPNSRTNDAVSALRSAGYRLFYVSRAGREYGFFLPASA